MKRFTIDSSVFVAALREKEEKHKECKKILENIVKGKYQAVEPYSVLVEITAAIRRRTGSVELAKRVKEDFLRIESIAFEELVRFRAEQASELASIMGLRGMDAIVLQTARENNCSLVSLDSEMLNLVKKHIKIESIEDLAAY